MLRIALVDDHALFRAGIRSILAAHPHIEVVAEGSSGADALRIAQEFEPNVLLLDIDMPGMSGLEATRRIVESGLRVRVLVLTMHVEQPFPQRLLESGALGYLGKGCAAAELLTAIERVAAGRRYIQAEVAQELVLTGSQSAESPFAQLTRRELDVAFGTVKGQRPRALAKLLGVSEKTVSTYKSRVLEKLGISSVAELTRLAITYGVLQEPSASTQSINSALP